MKKNILTLLFLVISLQIQSQITYQNVNPDCSSTVVNNQNQSNRCSINIGGAGSISFRLDATIANEWFIHVESTSFGFTLQNAFNNYGKQLVRVYSNGQTIDGNNQYSFPSSMNDPIISDNSNANFGGLGDRYIGFRSNTGIIGWILINVTGNTLIVKEYAYRTGTSINAGEGGSTLFNESFEKELGFKIYPNPVNNLLNIEIDNEIQNAKIYSISGSLLKNENNLASNNLDVSDLQKGYYFLKINDTKTIPFIKE